LTSQSVILWFDDGTAVSPDTLQFQGLFVTFLDSGLLQAGRRHSALYTVRSFIRPNVWITLPQVWFGTWGFMR